MVFLGKFDGILVRLLPEQSTMAPSLAQVHESGHELADESPNTAKSSQIQQPILIMVASFFHTLDISVKAVQLELLLFC